MGSMLSSGELLFSSIGAGATKLKPLKSWWALALGGIPGESEYTKKINKIDIGILRGGKKKATKNLESCLVVGARLQFPWLQEWLQLLSPKAFDQNIRVRRCGFTFRCFSGELWVEAECVIWFTCCGLKWGLEFSPVQFLRGGGQKQVHTCRKTHVYMLEIKPYHGVFFTV